MDYPPLVYYNSEDNYRNHYYRMYCSGPVVTFDGIRVRFRRQQFEHCFFESLVLKDDTFSMERAKRIDWIKAALQDPESEKYVGYNKRRNRHDRHRRVIIVKENYVVVISIIRDGYANFITAYYVDESDTRGRESTLDKIRQSPVWNG